MDFCACALAAVHACGLNRKHNSGAAEAPMNLLGLPLRIALNLPRNGPRRGNVEFKKMLSSERDFQRS